MINKENLQELLLSLEFTKEGKIFTKNFDAIDNFLRVDFDKGELHYPSALKVNGEFTTSFSSNENFVVFECVHRLLKKGYKPEHIELEPKWKLGHGASGGRADILVSNHSGHPLLLIECKTEGREFDKAWKDTYIDGGQLFSYTQQIPNTEFLCIYASDFIESTKEIKVSHRIISHKDNPKILEQNDTLKSFKNAQNLRERYEVWKDTYQLEYTENGIFEDNIQPYQIGKDKYTLENDTRPIDATDKKGKYHLFRTILRKHNIARKENAFEVLVNLFLCKIVDEKENKADLKFYWKGIANDNYFDFVDRLQELYKTGMKQFLGQEITYISNEQIESAFWTVKNKRNATKKQIEKYFRDLKFFTNNAFAFTDIFNEDIFRKNVKILIEIVQMWQGLRLKTKEQNQFLGDMFEYFLDNSIKQSEGQFFTPVPVCKFIVMSLPLETMIQQSSETIKAIDFACGAGHFLNEYATQIKPYIKQYKQTEPSDYYKDIYGIEKEDRLAKVAKISAFMYGQDEIKILDADALDDLAIEKFGKLPKFDVLVANPPFAVEDFLETLDEKQRAKYSLFTPSLDLGNKNIQCFFIERAKQLLALNGVAGIIVPSSVLSNTDATHIGTREILLKYFDIIAIVELGSGTFGKTGTNTVVLFLRRKPQQPEPAVHYLNRVDDFFEGIREGDSDLVEYQDLYLIRRYCDHIQIPYEEYKKLLNVSRENLNSIEPLFEFEMFKDYKADFDKSSEIVNLKKKAFFRNKKDEEQQEELKKRLVQYIREIERDKLYYFILAESNPQKVLVVKSPSDNKEQKQFLGYEWSGSKGQEGIKYNGGEVINDIITPLFDPNNVLNSDKINYYIQQNFQGNQFTVPEHLQPFISFSPLEDLLDFSRKDFNKAFSLSPKKNRMAESKWDLIKLGNISEIIAGQSPESEFYNELQNGLPFYQGKKDFGSMFLESPTVWSSKITKESLKNDILMSVRAPVGDVNLNPFDKICIGRGLAAIRGKNGVLQRFLFEFINQNKYLFKGNAQTTFEAISIDDLREIKIPLPPLSVQSQIVAECEIVDQAESAAKHEIISNKDAIENIILDIFGKFHEKKISEVANINPSKVEIRNIDENIKVSFVEMASVSDQGFIIGKVDRPLKELKKGSYTYFAENDIIIAKITPCMENGKCAIAKGLSNGLAMGSSEFHVIRAKEGILNNYMFYILNRDIVRKEAEQNFTGSSGHRRVPASFYENYRIPVPPLSVQQEIVAEIEILEQQIATAQQIISSAASQKQAIMKKYL